MTQDEKMNLKPGDVVRDPSGRDFFVMKVYPDSGLVHCSISMAINDPRDWVKIANGPEVN